MSRRQRSKTAAWYKRQQADPYNRSARAAGYRSRAAYKLLAIDQLVHLLSPGMTVVDLGATPGGWSQVIAERVGSSGRVVAIDCLPMQPIKHVHFIQGDYQQATLRQTLLAQLGGKVDVVTSDLSPNLTGIAITDQEQAVALAELVLDFSMACLHPRGRLLLKAFEGSARSRLQHALEQSFKNVRVLRPDATRSHSREFYFLASQRRSLADNTALLPSDW